MRALVMSLSCYGALEIVGLLFVISAPSLSTFRQRLKTFLFQASSPDIIIDPRQIIPHLQWILK